MNIAVGFLPTARCSFW